jgi:nicotinamide-nucleotide amidase
MRTGILHIGDELLTGETVPFQMEIVGAIRRKGARLSLLEVLGDREDDIVKGLEHAYALGIDVLVVTGGLGPTLDDVTREALARFLGVDLMVDPGAEAEMAAALSMMHKRPIMMNDVLRRMAQVPRGARPLKNITGAACGVEAVKDNMTIFLLPGFPDEMLPMFKEYILPRIEGTGEVELEIRVWRGEASMEPLFEKVFNEFPVSIASLPCKNWREEGNRVIIRGPRKDAEAALARLQELLLENEDEDQLPMK